MGTWSQPHTVELATKLSNLMQHPILAKGSHELLYYYVGDDELHDLLDQWPSDSDIREVVQEHLYKTLNELHLSLVKWDKKAIEICRQLADDPLPNPQRKRQQ